MLGPKLFEKIAGEGQKTVDVSLNNPRSGLALLIRMTSLLAIVDNFFLTYVDTVCFKARMNT